MGRLWFVLLFLFLVQLLVRAADSDGFSSDDDEVVDFDEDDLDLDDFEPFVARNADRSRDALDRIRFEATEYPEFFGASAAAQERFVSNTGVSPNVFLFVWKNYCGDDTPIRTWFVSDCVMTKSCLFA